MACTTCNRLGNRAPKLDLFIEQGSDFRKSFQVKNQEGEVKDLSDWTSIVGQAKREQVASEPVAFTFDMRIEQSENRVYFELPRASTINLVVGDTDRDSESLFYYDFIVTKTDGTTFRLQQGRAFVARIITRGP